MWAAPRSSSGLLVFDLSTLPSTTGVAWARLRVYVDKVNAGGTLDLGTANAPWAETAVSGTSGDRSRVRDFHSRHLCTRLCHL